MTPQRAAEILAASNAWPFFGNSQPHMTPAEYADINARWLADTAYRGSFHGYLARIARGEIQ